MGKNPNGSGGKVKKMPNRDLYRARYTDANGKQKSVYGKNHDECRKKLTEAMSNKDNGLNFDAGSQTVGQYMTRWLEDSARGDLAPRTYHSYRLQIRAHIVPAFGRTKLARLSPAHIQSLYAAKLRDGLKPSSVRYTHAVLHRSLEQAVKFGLIPRNPARVVDPPKIRQEEITPFTPEQARAFLEAARGERFEALYVVSLACGLRMGEALGLKWGDVDLEAGTMRVNRQLQRMRRDGEQSGTLTFSEPKNASRRTVDLPQRAIEALRTHRKGQTEEILGASEYEDSGLVFASVKGTPLEGTNIVNRFFKPLLRRSGLRAVRWHDLRHTYSTLLLSQGVHPKYVQQSLGHASIRLTLDRYSHWMPTMGRNAAEGIDEALG